MHFTTLILAITKVNYYFSYKYLCQQNVVKDFYQKRKVIYSLVNELHSVFINNNTFPFENLYLLTTNKTIIHLRKILKSDLFYAEVRPYTRRFFPYFHIKLLKHIHI